MLDKNSGSRGRPRACSPGVYPPLRPNLFTPCTARDSLVEAMVEAARIAASGDKVLISPFCPDPGQFKTHAIRGEEFYTAVESISWGENVANPNMMVISELTVASNQATSAFIR